MSQLIRMRQRMKAIGTIKKITSAMRLVSRSLHTKMNREKIHLIAHQNTLRTLFKKLSFAYPAWNSQVFAPDTAKFPQELYIIVGAQKGLCGTYNTDLIYWIKRNTTLLKQPHVRLVMVGKKMKDHLKKYGLNEIEQFEELTIHTIHKITQELIGLIFSEQRRYSKITLVNNYAQTFFTHRHKETVLIPVTSASSTFIQDESVESDYLWLNDPQTLLDRAALMYLRSTIHTLLFEALSGEQAARFVAMDNATRNADTFLDTLKLQYNKLRQAKITKELGELAGNFQE